MRCKSLAPMMLRVRPAQWTTTSASGSGTSSEIRNASSPPGALRLPGIVARRCSSGSPGIEEDNVFAALLAGVQFLGTHGGHMVHHLHLLPKILAGHVHAPLGGIARSGPVVDAPVEYLNVAIAHALQGGCSERCPSSIIVADDDQGALVRYQTPHPKFQLPARDQAGAGDMRAVVFTRFSYVNAGAGRLGIEQVLEICKG